MRMAGRGTWVYPRFSTAGYNKPLRVETSAVLRSGKTWVVDIDLEKYFDTVNHDRLMARLAEDIQDKRVLKLIREYLKVGILQNGVILDRQQSTPQGGPLSPLLASEEQQRKRCQNTLGDLAHGLKAPFSVIRSVLEKQYSDHKHKPHWQTNIDEQVERVSNIISHQRSRASRSKVSFLSSVDLADLFTRLSKGMGLAVAVEIVSSYDGGIEVKHSTLGGALFLVILPC